MGFINENVKVLCKAVKEETWVFGGVVRGNRRATRLAEVGGKKVYENLKMLEVFVQSTRCKTEAEGLAGDKGDGEL